MKCQNRIYEDSFDYQKNTLNERVLECVKKIEEIHIYCKEISENIYYPSSLYEKEFIQGKSLCDWLFDGDDQDSDEKAFLLELIKTWSRDEVDLIENTIHICFYKIANKGNENLAQGKSEWFLVRRNYLTKCEAKADFFGGLKICFPNLCFSLTLEDSLNSLPRFKSLTAEIVKHLVILNDIALKDFNEHGEKGALDRMAICGGFDCSNEGDAERVKRFLTFDFLTDLGDVINVKCSPHTKLIRADSDARIYFTWKHEQIGGGSKLLVGRIGTHPY